MGGKSEEQSPRLDIRSDPGRDDLATARAALDALARGDRDAIVAALDRDVRVRVSGPLWTRRYRGVEALLDAYQAAQRRYHGFALELGSVQRDDDGSILVVAAARTRSRDGERLAGSLRGVLMLEAGQIKRVYVRSARRRARQAFPPG